MHGIHLFQSELKDLAHFSFQEGLYNLVSAFAWRRSDVILGKKMLEKQNCFL